MALYNCRPPALEHTVDLQNDLNTYTDMRLKIMGRHNDKYAGWCECKQTCLKNKLKRDMLQEANDI